MTKSELGRLDLVDTAGRWLIEGGTLTDELLDLRITNLHTPPTYLPLLVMRKKSALHYPAAPLLAFPYRLPLLHHAPACLSACAPSCLCCTPTLRMRSR